MQFHVVLEGKDYSKREVITMLKDVRGEAIPRSTFYFWLKQLAIAPKAFYPLEEVRELIKLCECYRRGLTINHYIYLKKQEETCA